MAKGKCDKVWGNQQNLVWKKFRVWRHHRPQESLPDICVCSLFLQVSCGKCGQGLGHEFLGDGPDEGSRF